MLVLEDVQTFFFPSSFFFFFFFLIGKEEMSLNAGAQRQPKTYTWSIQRVPEEVQTFLGRLSKHSISLRTF